jgi:O-antigen/teichoic acid export membrane protein
VGAVLRNQFMSLVGARGAGSLLQALMFVLLGRSVPVDTLGAVVAVVSAGSFLSVVFDFGAQTYLTRARALTQLSAVRGALRLNRVSGFGLSVVGSLALAGMVSLGLLPWPVILLAGWLSVEKIVETALGVFIADGSLRIPATSIFLRRVTALSLFAALAAIGCDPLLAYGLSQLLGSVGGLLHIEYHLRKLAMHNTASQPVKDVLSSSWPFWLSGVTGQARALDSVMVAVFVGPYAAGLYGAAGRLVNPFLLASGALSAVILPHSARATAQKSREIATKLLVGGILFSILLASSWFFADELMVLLFGSQYSAAGKFLTIALIGMPLLTLTSQFTSILHGWGQERYIALNSLTFAIFLVAAMLCGSLWFGALGLAFVIAIAYTLRALLLYWRILKTSSLTPKGFSILSGTWYWPWKGPRNRR